MTDKEKLFKVKKLADAMYYSAQNLTTDASRLHKAMEEYHQFIIHEYHKEEPVSEEFNAMCLDENGNPTLAKETDFTRGFVKGAQWQKRKDSASVSEDLEEAAIEYCGGNKGSDARVRAGFIIGANWQKEQFEKNRLKHCNELTEAQAALEQGFIDQHLDKHQRMPTFLDAIEYGMQFMKEQLMKDAINAKIGSFTNGTIYDADFNIDSNLKDNDKVKIIVIKED